MTNNETTRVTFESLTEQIKCQSVIVGSTYAIATSPTQCLIFSVNENGEFIDNNDEVTPLDQFYEATVFCNDWQINATRIGSQAMINTLSNDSEMIDQNYLIWGKVSDVQNGWCTLIDPRIGAIYVPAPKGAKVGDRLRLTAVEHLQTHESGNVFISAQRLTGIEVAA